MATATLATQATRAAPAVRLRDVRSRLVPYATGLEWQREAQRRAWARHDAATLQAAATQEAADAHELILLEHEPTITVGVRAASIGPALTARALPPGTVTVRVDRGGLATYHGPGQLTGYLLFDLTQPPMRRDLHWMIRTMESAVVDALRDGLGVADAAPGPPGRSGVWVGNAKVCAVGLGVKRWVTMHGFGLNVSEEAERGFDAIVPCGLPDATVTSVSRLLGRRTTTDEVRPLVRAALERAYGVTCAAAREPDP